MYRYEVWTIKKAEHRRIDAFKLWCWRRLLRVPRTAKRSNQSFLKEIKPEYSLEDWCWVWNSNTLATWCEDLTYLKRSWRWERFKTGGEGDKRGWGGLDGITDLMDMSLSKPTPGVGDGQGNLVCCSPWGCKESDTTELLNWTECNECPLCQGSVIKNLWMSSNSSISLSAFFF